MLSSNGTTQSNVLLVNNAGFVLGVDRIGAINPDEVESMFATNVIGLIDMTQVFVNRRSRFNRSTLLNSRVHGARLQRAQ